MIKLLLSLTISILALANSHAQDTIYVYQKVGGIIKHAVSNVDSVIFYKPTIVGITNPNTVNDIDGNVYNIITIGGQVWMKENLKVTKYKDNTAIPFITDNTAWSNLTTAGYCFYNNSITGGAYGALYNWYTVNTNKLCPTGWHVPSDAEWTVLINQLGGGSVAGGKLKSTGTTYWSSPNTGATNETSFEAFGGGNRHNSGAYINFGNSGFWWGTTEFDAINAYSFALSYFSGTANTNAINKKSGFSVRCVRD